MSRPDGKSFKIGDLVVWDEAAMRENPYGGVRAHELNVERYGNGPFEIVRLAGWAGPSDDQAIGFNVTNTDGSPAVHYFAFWEVKLHEES